MEFLHFLMNDVLSEPAILVGIWSTCPEKTGDRMY